MGNWWLVLFTALIAIALPAVGQLVEPQAFVDPAKPPPLPEKPVPVAATSGKPLMEGAADARP